MLQLADKRCGLTTKVTLIDKLLASYQTTRLEPTPTPDSCDTPEISGRKHFVTRDIDTFSEPQTSLVKTIVGSFSKKLLLESSELLNALKSSKFSDSYLILCYLNLVIVQMGIFLQKLQGRKKF
uniref:Uncharacterized protein n=1 Tax=Picea sitchensis TaxID=3332 RepID=A9NPU1_PICSI|nr:unknown [Picea sitchensis]